MGKVMRMGDRAWLFAMVSLCFGLGRVLVLPSRDGALTLLQVLLGLVCLQLPYFLRLAARLRIPTLMSSVYLLFIWASVFLGEVWGFYYRFSGFDDGLHLLSSAMTGVFGFSLFDMLSGGESEGRRALRALFSFSLALSVGCLWEVYEFTLDGLLGLNMQKHSYPIGEGLAPLLGREALADTMKDICVDCLGGGLASLSGYLILRLGRRWPEALRVRLEPR